MRIRLSEISTRAPKDFDKAKTQEKTLEILSELDELQNLLYAESQHCLLVVLQGMDASGKDGTIRKVFGKLNPQGVFVKSFKVPAAEELAHDFLWRVHYPAPAKGIIVIFNRSHYEDILVTRVHKWCDDKTAKKRMKAINDFENLLYTHNNTEILKFYLHISRKEQEERLLERIKDSKKQWKYNEKDLEEAKLYDEYIEVYEDAIENCNDFPWTIVPADQNWYKEYVIAKVFRDRLKDLKMQYPGLKRI